MYSTVLDYALDHPRAGGTSQITLHCGDWRCSRSQFSLLVETSAKRHAMQRKRSNWEMGPRFSSVTKSVPMNILGERKFQGLKSKRPLVELCIDFGSSNCEDRRDKVFGLQWFTVACCMEAVKVNYSASISEISWQWLEDGWICSRTSPGFACYQTRLGIYKLV
jgi:hypothetical protein